MATTATTSSDSTTASTETVDQDNTDTDQTDPDETLDESTDTDQSQDNAPPAEDVTKPDDKKDPAKAALLADLHSARTARKTAQDKVTALEATVAELSPVKETLDAVQRRSDRLEEFISTAGGPLGKALDSKSFTTALFDTDEDITEIVKKWNASNPSATSTALGSSSAAPAGKAPDMNALLRSALK